MFLSGGTRRFTSSRRVPIQSSGFKDNSILIVISSGSGRASLRGGPGGDGFGDQKRENLTTTNHLTCKSKSSLHTTVILLVAIDNTPFHKLEIQNTKIYNDNNSTKITERSSMIFVAKKAFE